MCKARISTWESKNCQFGTNVFKGPHSFCSHDFNVIVKALKYKKIELDEMRAVARSPTAGSGRHRKRYVRARYGRQGSKDVSFYGQTPRGRISTLAPGSSAVISALRNPNAAQNVCLIVIFPVQKNLLSAATPRPAEAFDIGNASSSCRHNGDNWQPRRSESGQGYFVTGASCLRIQGIPLQLTLINVKR